MPSRPPTRSAPSRPATSHNAAASSTSPDQGDWLLSILPSRETAGDVGVVALEKELGHVVVTQYTDSRTFVKTVHLCETKPPSIILLPQTALDSVRGKRRGLAAVDEEEDEGGETAAGGVNSETALLVKSLEELFPSVPLVGVVRKYWNEQAGPLRVPHPKHHPRRRTHPRPHGLQIPPHTFPATAVAARQGHLAELDAAERAVVERKMREKASGSGVVCAAEDNDAADDALAEIPLDVAVNEPLTWKTFLEVVSKPYTWLPALMCMTTFGFELAVDANLPNVLYADHKGPNFGQLEAGYYTSVFGFLDLFTRPFGGFLADMLYRRFGLGCKKHSTVSFGH